MVAHKFRVNKTRRQTNQLRGERRAGEGGRLVLSFVLVGCANNKFVTSRFDSCVSQRAAPLVATKPQGRAGRVAEVRWQSRVLAERRPTAAMLADNWR